LIDEVREITPEIMSLAGDAGSALGTGGMTTKLIAAKIIMEAGGDMVIANGKEPQILYDIAEGKKTGTRFLGGKENDHA
jgi:glutamate 5-kinase